MFCSSAPYTSSYSLSSFQISSHYISCPTHTHHLLSYLSHPGLSNQESPMWGRKSLRTLYTLMFLLWIAFLLGISLMLLVTGSILLPPFPQIWLTVPWCQSVAPMHLTLKLPMLLAPCTSPNFVIHGVLIKKHECLPLPLSFVPLLENTRVGKPGIPYAFGSVVSVHSMSSIMHLGLVMMNGFNWPGYLQTMRIQSINTLFMLPSPLSTC